LFLLPKRYPRGNTTFGAGGAGGGGGGGFMVIILKSEDLEWIITVCTLHTNMRESMDTYGNRQNEDERN
jgi:hypothetical protein